MPKIKNKQAKILAVVIISAFVLGISPQRAFAAASENQTFVQKLICSVSSWWSDQCLRSEIGQLTSTDQEAERQVEEHALEFVKGEGKVVLVETTKVERTIEQGETGATGKTGDTGAQGSQGIQGEKGEIGPQGQEGLAGAKGENGKDGKDGKDGEDGQDASSIFGASIDSSEITDGTITFSDWASNSCTNEQVPKYNSTSGVWECGNDAGGTSYSAGSGLSLTGSTFALKLDGSTLTASASGLKISDTYDDNFALTNGSYANPSWITSLAGAKITGNISGNAGTVTNGIYTTTDFGGDVSGAYDAIILDNSGVSAGTYGNSGASVTQLTIDAKGRVTSASERTLTKSDLSLGNVENTSLSLWTGTNNITTLGTIGTGVWHGSDIALGTYTSGNYVASIANGTGISGGTGGSEGAALTLSLNINGLTGSSAVASDDYIPMYDTSAASTFKVSRSDFLSGLTGSLNYQGSWDASSLAAPETCDTTNTKGHYWVASKAGNGYAIGDWAICNGTTWQKLNNSVNVSSVFGRIGAVTANAGDYTADKITNTPSGNIASTDVQSVLNELDTEKLAIGGSITSLDVPAYSGNAGKILAVNGTANGVVWASGLTTSLASGNIYVGNGSGVATAVAVSGDAVLGNTGVLTIANDAITSAKISDGTITNGDISGSASIADSKLASITTANKVSGAAIQLGTNSGLEDSTGLMINLNGTSLSLGATGLSLNLANANTWSGMQTFSNAIVAPISSNTINGLIINSGALSGATTLSISGAITGATSTNTINGLVINSGALSNVASLVGSGALSMTSGGTNTALTLSSNGTGAINVGTDYADKNISIGNTSPNTALTLSSGAGMTINGPLTINGNITVNGNILPGTDATYALGSSAKQWKDVYASTNSIYIGGTALSNSSGTLQWNGSAVGGGGGTTTVQSVSSNATLTTWTRTAKVDATSGTVTVTLPTAVGNGGQIVEVVKTDNSTNVVKIAPNGTQTINGSTNNIYLYSQNDSVVIRSDGTNSYVVADNRSSVGASENYLYAIQTVTQAAPSVGTALHFDSVSNSYGGDITLSNNTFTLKAGKTYHLSGSGAAMVSASAGRYGVQWYNVTTSSYIGPTSFYMAPANAAYNAPANGPATVVITPAVDTQVQLRVNTVAGGGVIGGSGLTQTGGSGSTDDPNSASSAMIQEISTPQNVVNTVDYGFVRFTGTDTATLADGAQITFDSTLAAGNMTYSGSKFTLIAGKTYDLTAQLVVYNSANPTAGKFEFYDYTNSTSLATSARSTSVSANGAITGNAAGANNLELVYTPTQNIQVGVRLVGHAGPAPGIVGGASFATDNGIGGTYFKVIQIGSTASTALALNTLAGALATGSLDSLNFGQTWNWSTATTQAALTMTGNALTTGGLLSLTSSSASLDSTNGLLYVANTGASQNGIVARIQSNSTAGSGLTVLANGNVGIGTTSPTVVLHMVKANAEGTPTFNPEVAAAVQNNANSTSWSALSIVGGTAGRSQIYFSDKDNQTAGTIQYDHSANALLFSTNGNNERMRINSSGFVGIGTTNPTGAWLTVQGDGSTSTDAVAIKNFGDNYGYGITMTPKTYDATAINFTDTVGSSVGYIRINGIGNVTYSTTSDQRLKENIVDTHYGVLDLMKIDVKDFSFKSDPDHHMMNGFIAQELQKIYPDAVVVGTDEVDEKGNLIHPWSVDYGRLTPLIIKSIQDQQGEIEANINEITALDLRTKNIVGVEDGKTVFKGTVVADTIQANTIQGLNFASDTQMSAADAQLVAQGQTLNNISQELAELQAKITGTELSLNLKDLQVSGGATFKSSVQFQGPAVFKALAQFIDKVVFKNDVEFAGNVTADKDITAQNITTGRVTSTDTDSAGLAVIKSGDTSVKIEFSDEYSAVPIVTITPNDFISTQYKVKDVTEKGFEIMIKEKADDNMTFTWTAVAVKNAKTTTSDGSGSSSSSVQSTPTTNFPSETTTNSGASGSSTSVSTEGGTTSTDSNPSTTNIESGSGSTQAN